MIIYQGDSKGMKPNKIKNENENDSKLNKSPLNKLRRRYAEGEVPTEVIACRVTPALCIHLGVMAAARNVSRGTLVHDMMNFIFNDKDLLAKFEEYSKPLIKVS